MFVGKMSSVMGRKLASSQGGWEFAQSNGASCSQEGHNGPVVRGPKTQGHSIATYISTILSAPAARCQNRVNPRRKGEGKRENAQIP